MISKTKRGSDRVWAAASLKIRDRRSGVADKVVFMRDGVVVEEGPPAQVIDNPQQEATRSFLGRIIGRAA